MQKTARRRPFHDISFPFNDGTPTSVSFAFLRSPPRDDPPINHDKAGHFLASAFTFFRRRDLMRAAVFFLSTLFWTALSIAFTTLLASSAAFLASFASSALRDILRRYAIDSLTLAFRAV